MAGQTWAGVLYSQCVRCVDEVRSSPICLTRDSEKRDTDVDGLRIPSRVTVETVEIHLEIPNTHTCLVDNVPRRATPQKTDRIRVTAEPQYPWVPLYQAIQLIPVSEVLLMGMDGLDVGKEVRKAWGLWGWAGFGDTE